MITDVQMRGCANVQMKYKDLRDCNLASLYIYSR
jgi:hypothetical protein